MTTFGEEQHHAWLARSFGRTDYLLLSPEDLAALGDAGEYLSWEPGDTLFREGMPSENAFVLRRGVAELSRGTDRDRKIIARMGSGAVLGDIALFRGSPYHSTATVADHTEALRLHRTRLLPLLVERPVIALRWLISGLDQLERTQRRVLRLLNRTVLERVGDLLADEGDDRDEVHLSQSAMATLLGATRQSVNEALGILRDRGAIETGYRRVTVIDRSRLP